MNIIKYNVYNIASFILINIENLFVDSNTNKNKET